MTAPRTPQWERRLLHRIQFRLILWYICAFLLFELIIVTTSTVVLRYQVMRAARYTVAQEWVHAKPDAVNRLRIWDEANGHHPVWVDSDREVVTTWLMDIDGHYIEESPVLLTKRGPVRVNHAMVVLARSLPSPVQRWEVGKVGDVSILIGIHPVSVDGHFAGDLVSTYSILSIMDTVHTLIRVNAQIGLCSLLVIFLLTIFLSVRSLLPIQAALHRQRNFVNDAAHQLRAPITILRGNLELASTETDVETLQQAIRDCLAETDYLSGLVRDLSALARYESGATPLQYTAVDLTAVTEGLIDQMQVMSAPKDIAIHLSAPTEPVVMVGDAARIRQLTFILLENAIKYNIENGTIWVSLQNARHHCRIEIRDTGIGIPKSDIPHIFDRFYRSARASRFAPGSGIGLSVAASIVDSHRGHIGVTSEKGQGTTFTITLPRVPSHSWLRSIR